MDRQDGGALRLHLSVALGVLTMLGGCGGGSGGGGGGVISTPGPAPSPTPSPAPVPTPTPTPTPTPSTFDTAEYRQSDGPAFHNAVAAWQQGATGQGATIAIVDTGIDTDSPEFAGRISPASADVAGNGTFEAFDDHGTQVALTAAAARNNTGIVGIAYGATIQALRADTPGSCATADPSDSSTGCVFDDRDIAAGIDRAVAAGATVINLSLGGDSPSSTLITAVKNAAAAGVVIVVAAGNEGDGSDPTIDPNQPNPFASGVLGAGGAEVIIAGSVDKNGVISSFSNRAGSSAGSYLAALGEDVCCVYKDGKLLVETDSQGSFVTLVSGTSFSAPQISGAVALLKSAFPNLTGAQIVEILLSSARDAGAVGTDKTYGRGILDIARAFAPQGTTTLAGSASALYLNDDTAIGSAPMGDAFRSARLDTVMLDKYARAYAIDLAAGLQHAAATPRLLGAVDKGPERLGLAGKAVSLAFTVAPNVQGLRWDRPLRLTAEDASQAQVMAARAALRISPNTQIGFAFRERADGLVAQLQGHDEPAFLIVGGASGDLGFAETGGTAVAWRRQLGKWGLTATAESGEAWLGTLRMAQGTLDRRRETQDLHQVSLAADRTFGKLDTALGVSMLDEDRTVLGAYFHQALEAGGARTVFLDAQAGWRVAPRWRIGGALRQGWTRADTSGLVAAGSRFVSRAWSFDVERSGVFGPLDSLGLRIAQPLRVESGGLALNLPIAYDYDTLLTTYGVRTLSLTPGGRELDGELAWRGALFGGNGSASLFYRTDPGNVASLPDDKGIALNWDARF
jgi:subtilisin family serine protease